MRYEWFISLRYLKPGRGWNIRLITGISIFGVLLGVAALVLVLSVMGGFAADLREKILATKAHVVVDAHSGSLADWTEMLDIIEEHPGVVGASPYIQSELMISTATNVDGILLRGIDTELVGQTNNIAGNVQVGDLEWLHDPNQALAWRRQTEPLSFDEIRRSTETLRDEIEQMRQDHDEALEAIERLNLRDAGTGQGTEDRVESTDDPLDLTNDPLLPVDADGDEPEGTGHFVMPPIPVREASQPNGNAPDVFAMDPIPIPDSPGPGSGPDSDFVMDPVPLTPPSDPNDQVVIPGIIIGTELAIRLHVEVGSEVTLISPDGQLLPTGPAPLARPFRVVGTFFTGMYEFDTRFAYVLLEEARSLFRIPGDNITAIDIRVSELERSEMVAETLQGEMSAAGFENALVRSWNRLNKGLFTALKLEKVVVFVILAIIILVASFSIVAGLVVKVVERAGEIAVLKSMGASNRGIMKAFAIEGGIIGFVGTSLGVLIGIGLCLFIQGGGIPLDTEVYYIESLPVQIEPVEVLLTAAAGMLISLLATLYPAIKAARLNPADGLRLD